MKISKTISMFLLLVAILFAPLAVKAEGCTPFSKTYVSGVGTPLQGGGSSVLAYMSPLWATTISGSNWIWKTEYVTNPEQEDTETFVVHPDLPAAAQSAVLTIAADDYFKITINEAEIASEFGEGNFLESNIHQYQLASNFTKGENTLLIKVINAPYFFEGEGTPFNNTAGVLYHLAVQGETCVVNSSSESTPHFTNGAPMETPSGTGSGSANLITTPPTTPDSIADAVNDTPVLKTIFAPFLGGGEKEEVTANQVNPINLETPADFGWLTYGKYLVIALSILSGIFMPFVMGAHNRRKNRSAYLFLVPLTFIALVSIVIIGLLATASSSLMPYVVLVMLICIAAHVYFYGKKA